MTIRAGFGITGATDQAPALPGTLGGGALTRGYLNQSFAQVSTWTVAGVDTSGVHSVTIQLQDGSNLTATYTATVAPDDNDAVAAGLAASVNTLDAWRNVATAAAVGAVVTVTYLHTGIVYPLVSTVVQGGASITVANTTNAGGANFPTARFFITTPNAQGDDGRALALPDGATADQLAGVSSRPHGKIENSRSIDPAVNEAWPVGEMVDGCYFGPIQMVNQGAAALAGGLVHVVTATAGGDELGEVRGDAQNSVVLPRAQAYWKDATDSGASGWVYLRM
jgi:hypothetical protein